MAGVSDDTVKSIYADIGDKMHRYNESQRVDFSVRDIIEMDETYIKWKEGKLEGNWVLGAVNRDYTKCWLVVIEDRTTANMEGLIRSVAKPRSIVMTDALTNYPNIMKRIGCTHYVINKKEEGFSRVDEATGIEVNVNKCECLWSKFRHLMQQRNMFDATTRYRLIAEFMYNFTEKNWIDLIVF